MTWSGILVLDRIQPDGGAEVEVGTYFRSVKTHLGLNLVEEILRLRRLLGPGAGTVARPVES